MKNPRRPAGRAGAGDTAGAGRDIAGWLAEGLRHHQAGHLTAAAAAYRRVLARDPDQPDALHLAGLVAHAEGDRSLAAALIERAIAANPRPAAFHNSLGVVCLDAGDAERALVLFDQALARDPCYAEAYLNRGNALQQLGRLAAAIAAYDQALALRADYPEALAGQGRALHRLDRPAEAVDRFARALRQRPAWPKVLRWQGDSLAECGRCEAAAAALAQALALDPDDAETLAAQAALAERDGRLEEALAAADQALAGDPGTVRAALAAARALRRMGRPQDGLARLAPFAVAGPAAAAAMPPEAAALVQFERAMLLDRQGDPAAAYAAFADAHQRMEAVAPPTAADRAFFPELIRRLARQFTPEWANSWTAPAPPDPDLPPDPVFLLGFPRSGTTLLDQILDAHPALTTLEEKDAVDVLRRRVEAMPGGYPAALAALTPSEQADLRRRYWGEVERHLAGRPAGRLVDKMPLNTIDAGLIYRLFPEAQFLLALRHPADVVLSNFMQAFKPNAAMLHAASLAGAARFYAQVMGLWLQYTRVLPLACHAVRYEDLVADVEGEARRILRFLGVAWDDAVLAYRARATGRRIATPSYHQVVEPLYHRAIGRWQRYRPFFGEAETLLAPFVAAFRYDGGEGGPALTDAAADGGAGEPPPQPLS